MATTNTIGQTVLSQKGKPKLSVDGYLFKRNIVRHGTVYWRCDVGSCPATAKTEYLLDDDDDQIDAGDDVYPEQHRILYNNVDKHNHLPDPTQAPLLQLKADLKRRAETAVLGPYSPTKLIEEVESEHPDLVGYQGWTTNSKLQLIKRAKKRVNKRVSGAAVEGQTTPKTTRHSSSTTTSITAVPTTTTTATNSSHFETATQPYLEPIVELDPFENPYESVSTALNENGIPMIPVVNSANRDPPRIPMDCPSLLITSISLSDTCRAQLYSTPTNVRHLRTAPHWVLHQTCTADATQLVMTILAPVGVRSSVDSSTTTTTTTNRLLVPLVYLVFTVPTKQPPSPPITDPQLYVRALEEVVIYATSHRYQLCPPVITLDFDHSLVTAVQTVFPRAHVRGGLFQLGQQVWRQLRRAALDGQYGADSRFALYIRYLAALAYLPSDEIAPAFEQVARLIRAHQPQSEPLLVYFRQCYVLGRVSTGEPPLFPPAMWSVRNFLLLNGCGSLEPLESWHRKWTVAIGAVNTCHPFAMMQVITDQQAETEAIIEQVVGRSTVSSNNSNNSHSSTTTSTTARSHQALLHKRLEEAILLAVDTIDSQQATMELIDAIARNIHL